MTNPGAETTSILKKPDPFNFRHEGLAGKVIGALFLVLFLGMVGMGWATVRLFGILTTFTVAVKDQARAVQGFNATLYEVGNSFEELANEVRVVTQNPKPLRRPSWAPTHPAAAPATVRPAEEGVE